MLSASPLGDDGEGAALGDRGPWKPDATPPTGDALRPRAPAVDNAFLSRRGAREQDRAGHIPMPGCGGCRLHPHRDARGAMTPSRGLRSVRRGGRGARAGQRSSGAPWPWLLSMAPRGCRRLAGAGTLRRPVMGMTRPGLIFVHGDMMSGRTTLARGLGGQVDPGDGYPRQLRRGRPHLPDGRERLRGRGRRLAEHAAAGHRRCGPVEAASATGRPTASRSYSRPGIGS